MEPYIDGRITFQNRRYTLEGNAYSTTKIGRK
jgi:hypothetical protein